MPETLAQKTALVVSGGGSRGAFAVGAIEYLVNRRGLHFDIVAGTSTGALIAPLVVTGDIQRMKELYTHLTTAQVITPNPLAEAFLKYDALYDATPARLLIERDLTAAKARQILNASTQMFITTVNLNTGKTVFFYTGPPAVNLDPPHRSLLVRLTRRDELMRAILASGSEPVFMPPVAVNPHADTGAYRQTGDPGADIKPADRYVDGGVRDIAPIKIAIDNGATDIYAVVLSSRDRARKESPYTSLLDILTRTVDLFTQEITFKDVWIADVFNRAALYEQALRSKMRDFLSDRQIEAVFDAVQDKDPFRGTGVVKLYLIRPEARLPGSALDFKPDEMALLLLKGREQAKKVLDEGPLAMPLIA